MAALLELHEILFYESAGPARDLHFMDTMNEDYQTDRVALVQTVGDNRSGVRVLCASAKWPEPKQNSILDGPGIQRIVATHAHFEGALTLSRFRSSSVFVNGEWQSLWERDLMAPASALLSVPIYPRNQPMSYLWLVADSGSREWSSHDRDLSEEEALLLARIIENGLLSPQ